MDSKILSRLQTLCSRREYCTSEIYAKALKYCDENDTAACEIVADLVREKYVDDLRYASAFARDKSSLAGWGTVKIRFALQSKKIAAETISAALSEIDTDKAEEKLDKLLQMKARSLEGDPERRLKLLKFALSRGYDYQAVELALKRLGAKKESV